MKRRCFCWLIIAGNRPAKDGATAEALPVPALPAIKESKKYFGQSAAAHCSATVAAITCSGLRSSGQLPVLSACPSANCILRHTSCPRYQHGSFYRSIAVPSLQTQGILLPLPVFHPKPPLRGPNSYRDHPQLQ